MFKSAHSALAWALEVDSKPAVKLSATNRLAIKRRGGLSNPLIDDLAPGEMKLQAAVILRTAKNLLSPSQYGLLLAIYARDYSGLMSVADDLIIKHNEDAKRKPGYMLLVGNYLKMKVSKEDIRSGLKCNKNVVNDYIHRANKDLARKKTIAMALLGDKLREMKVIE